MNDSFDKNSITIEHIIVFVLFFSAISEEDYAELSKDVALLKKLKKKKISEEDYEKEIGLV